jgi:hypothetical protein
MGYTFISYSRKDVGFVQILVSSLRMRGIETVVRYRPPPTRHGLGHEIHAALKAAELGAGGGLAGVDGLARGGGRMEVRRYLGKPIIPVLYHDCELHYSLNALNYVDFRRGNMNRPSTPWWRRCASRPCWKRSGATRKPRPPTRAATNWLVRREAVQRLLDIGAGAVGGAGLGP